MNLFFDLETIPASESQHDLVREQFERRSTYSSSSYRKPVSFDEYLHGTSLDPNFGQILCIGVAINDEKTQVIQGKEADILTEFWKLAATVKQLVGHNALAFDAPFLWKRSILHGVKPTLPIDSDMKSIVYDTMLAWDLAMPRKHTSLDLLAKLFGIPTSKSKMDGSEVAAYYAAGKLTDIYEYCMRDVEVTRRVYKKLTFTATVEKLD